MVVQHHVGCRETLQAAHGDEAGIARARANQVDDALHRFTEVQSTVDSRQSIDVSSGHVAPCRHLSTVDCRLSTVAAAASISSAPRARARPPPAIRAPRRRSARPRRSARTARLPSGAATIATSSSVSSSSGDASAPIGVWQPPPRAVTSARSAVSATAASAVVDRRHRASCVVVFRPNLHRYDTLSGRRHAGGCGQGHRDPRREAQPSQSRGGENERIVLALVELAKPRVEVAANRQEASVRKQPRQLRDAPHAARADRGRRPQSAIVTAVVDIVESGSPDPALAGSGAPPRRAGLPAATTAAIVRPSGSTTGMSLLLWTARSISPRRRASSSSLTKRRFPPASESGASCRRSPEVLIVTSRHVRPVASRNPGGDGVGLPQRKLAAAGADSELAVGWHGRLSAGWSG